MKATIEFKEIDSASIGPPDMNFGQHQRWPAQQKRHYSLFLDNAEFQDKVGDCFEQLRQGEIADTYDENDRDEFPALFEWRELDFPPLDLLLTGHQQLLEKLLIYQGFEISHALTEFLDRGWECVFSVHSIDRVLFSADHVEVRGIAYEARAVNPDNGNQ